MSIEFDFEEIPTEIPEIIDVGDVQKTTKQECVVDSRGLRSEFMSLVEGKGVVAVGERCPAWFGDVVVADRGYYSVFVVFGECSDADVVYVPVELSFANILFPRPDGIGVIPQRRFYGKVKKALNEVVDDILGKGVVSAGENYVVVRSPRYAHYPYSIAVPLRVGDEVLVWRKDHSTITFHDVENILSALTPLTYDQFYLLLMRRLTVAYRLIYDDETWLRIHTLIDATIRMTTRLLAEARWKAVIKDKEYHDLAEAMRDKYILKATEVAW